MLFSNRFFLQIALTVFVILSHASAWVTAQEPTGVSVPPAALKLYEKLRSHTLPNGLKVYLLPVAGSPIVTVMTAYKVGSCDEDKSFTGLAHYLEHLMFKGTAKLMPGDIDRMTQRSGGSNNAYTNEDMTNYLFDFAADRWETALDIESQRMRGLIIDAKHEFEQEKGAVIEELARNEDQPWDLEQKAILPMLFGKSSPYGHPVIGEREHVRAATAEVIKGYYDQWYHPNNAVMIVVGGIEVETALVKIQQKFSDIPAGKLPERKSWPATYPARPARHEFPSKFPAARMLMGFVTVPQGHADEAALDVVSNLLASGKTSRLYKKLVLEERMAVDVGASHDPGRHPGWFGINVELLPGKDRGAAEKIVLAELRKLGQEALPGSELQRGQRLLLAHTMFEREGIHALADSIAKTVLVQPESALKEQIAKWAAVSIGDIQRVTKQYLDPEKPVVVWSVPLAGSSGAASTGTPVKPNRQVKSRQGNSAQPGSAGVSLQNAQKVVLPSGLTILMMENRRLPIVVAATLLRETRRYEPREKSGLVQLMGSLLEEGTARRTGPQIAEAIESIGGTLDMSSGLSSVKILSDDKRVGLEILFDCLMHPRFENEAFGRKKEEQLAEIVDAQEQATYRAADGFSAAVYGEHFRGRTSRGTLASVEKLIREDCIAFHKQVMTPDNVTLAVAGDFDSKELITLVTELTADWQGKLGSPPQYPEPALSPNQITQVITMPQAAQLQFFMGHLGIKRGSPDYFKLLVMDYVLGTGTGFTDRLSSRLRDREGLAYSVSANITDSAGDDAGTFTCYIGTDARNFGRVRQLFLEEIERLRRETPGELEVAGVKQYLLGRLAFALATNGHIAQELLTVNRYNLGFDYYERYRQAVQAVTPSDVKDMAEKYLHPDRFITVAAGAIDKEGKVLPRKQEK